MRHRTAQEIRATREFLDRYQFFSEYSPHRGVVRDALQLAEERAIEQERKASHQGIIGGLLTFLGGSFP